MFRTCCPNTIQWSSRRNGKPSPGRFGHRGNRSRSDRSRWQCRSRSFDRHDRRGRCDRSRPSHYSGSRRRARPIRIASREQSGGATAQNDKCRGPWEQTPPPYVCGRHGWTIPCVVDERADLRLGDARLTPCRREIFLYRSLRLIHGSAFSSRRDRECLCLRHRWL